MKAFHSCYLLVALYFCADQTIMKVERADLLLLTFPSHPCLQIILCTVLVAIFCFNIFNTSKITQKKQKGKLLVHVPITHTWDALKSLLESMNSNLEIKLQCISSVSVRVCNRVCIINTTQTKKHFQTLNLPLP